MGLFCVWGVFFRFLVVVGLFVFFFFPQMIALLKEKNSNYKGNILSLSFDWFYTSWYKTLRLPSLLKCHGKGDCISVRLYLHNLYLYNILPFHLLPCSCLWAEKADHLPIIHPQSLKELSKTNHNALLGTFIHSPNKLFLKVK